MTSLLCSPPGHDLAPGATAPPVDPPPDRDLSVDEPDLPATYDRAGEVLYAVLDGHRPGDDLRPVVRAAACRLDEVERGWFHRVDPTTLEVASVYRCVLAQVFGTYGSGLATVFGRRSRFDDEDPGGDPRRVAFLAGVPEHLWLAEVHARRALACVRATGVEEAS